MRLLQKFNLHFSRFIQRGVDVPLRVGLRSYARTNSGAVFLTRGKILNVTNSVCAETLSPISTSSVYSKKKKDSSVKFEEEESDDEVEYDTIKDDDILDDENVVTKSVPSLRVDSVLKFALGVRKRYVEKQFYASNLRLNEQRLLKKAVNVVASDEIDIVKGFSEENPKLLEVQRVIVVAIGKPTGVLIPVKLQVFKSLLIENYEDKWFPTVYEE